VRYGIAVKRYEEITDPSLARALAHPLRTRVLTALENRTASPSELADELGVALGVLSYHVRCLHAVGFLRLVKRVPRRGAVEHYYTTVAGPRITNEAWASTPAIVKQAMVSATLGEIGTQASAAAQAGGFEARDAHLSRTPVTVDQTGWEELAHELDTLISRIEQIEAESHARLAADGNEGAGAATVALMLFHTAVDVPQGDRHVNGKRRRRARYSAATS
jgi:DNA-binding transcriptional ArsR family regulator